VEEPKFEEEVVRFCSKDCDFRQRLHYFCDKYKEMLSFLKFKAVSCDKCKEESGDE